VQQFTSHVRGFVARQEKHGIRDLRGLTHASQRQSGGDGRRRLGVERIIAVMSVCVNPGATELTRVPRGAGTITRNSDCFCGRGT
jgi:hypothetical protein